MLHKRLALHRNTVQLCGYFHVDTVLMFLSYHLQATATLEQLQCRHRLLLLSSAPPTGPSAREELFGLLSFIRPAEAASCAAELAAVGEEKPGSGGGGGAANTAAQVAAVARMRLLLDPHCRRILGRQVYSRVVSRQEVMLPVELPDQQVRCLPRDLSEPG